MAGTQLSNAAATARREVWLTLIILAVLLAASVVPSSAYRYRPRRDTPVKKVFRTIHKRGLNREALAKQTAGYYEGLLDEAANVTQMGGRGLLDWRFWLVERRERASRESDHLRNRPDFLRFELRPGVNVADIDERRRVVTNSAGLMDREYDTRPASGTWRVVLIGDSVSQGIGAEPGRNYESRLETHLDQQFAGGAFVRHEILNLSVRGYQITQLADVGIERAPLFGPHAVAVALTERSVFTAWADHIAGLVRSGVDLKYLFLRDLVREAGITPNMTAAIINARLAPHRDRVIRWAVGEIRAAAARAGARFTVLLLPTADDPENQIEQFESTRLLLQEMGVPTVNLLETFAELDELDPVRVSAADKHPNDEGHRLLFEALAAQLSSDAALREIFTGER